MGKDSTPQAKKKRSLERDRRNVYGENAKASRKNIARGKQISHQRERSVVSQVLASIEPSPSEDSIDEIEHAVKVAERRLKIRRFKKVPDEPPGAILETRRAASPPQRPKLRSRVMYIESKAGSLTGPARIGRVLFSKTGRTLYYGDQAFRSLKGRGFKANYYDAATSQEYWISGPRKDGKDRLYDGGPPVLK